MAGLTGRRAPHHRHALAAPNAARTSGSTHGERNEIIPAAIAVSTPTPAKDPSSEVRLEAPARRRA